MINMKSNSRLLFWAVLVSIILVLPLCSADLGTFKQGECIPIVTVLNATSATLTNINSPTPSSTVLLKNQAMTKDGNLFNYTFCTTTKIGVYTYGYCDSNGNCYSNTFNVTPSGFTSTIIFYFIFLLIIVLVFIIGVVLKNKWIMFLGSTLVLLLGFFIIINGIDVIKDTRTTWGIGIIVWALAIYFIYLSIEEMLKEWN